MRFAIWINDVRDPHPAQTTAIIAAAAVGLGHEVLVVEVPTLGLDKRDRVVGSGRLAPPCPSGLPKPEWLSALRAVTPEVVVHDDLDGVMIRTNPARDPRAWAHEAALDLAALLEARGQVVLNAPLGLRRTQSKLYLANLPDTVRPRGIASADPRILADYVRSQTEPTVLKPVRGTRGASVFLVEPDDRNLNAIVESLVRGGTILAQECLPGAEQGDIRVVVLEGQELRQGEHLAAIARVPQGGEFRSNICLGGQAAPPTLSDEQLTSVRLIAGRLLAEGIVLAGVDLIGTRAVEVNVFSTGGLNDSQRFTGVNFAASIVTAFEARFAAK